MLINPNTQLVRSLNPLQLNAINNFNVDSSLKYEHLHNCPLCKSPHRDQIASKDQFGIYVATVLCSNCGLLYSADQLSEESTERFYDQYYRRIYEGVKQASLEHPYYKKLYAGWVQRVPSFINSSHLVVEIGCGGGWNLLPYHTRGIRHFGFDYDSDMVQYGNKNYGLNLHVGGLNEALATVSSADYLILSQVLEHLKDPVTFLTSLRSIFADKGLICITVPSIDYMKYLGGNSTHFDIELCLQNAHNFTFSEYTLNRLLLSSGYQPILVLGGYVLARANPDWINPRTINTLSHSSSLPIPTIKDISSIQSLKLFKYRLQKYAPRLVWNIASRLFYLSRPLKTTYYLYLNYILKVMPR